MSPQIPPTKKGRWEPHNEQIRRLYILQHKTEQEIHEETGHSLKAIKKTIAKIENGLAPPLDEGVYPESEEDSVPELEGEIRPASAGKPAVKPITTKETDNFSEANLLRIMPRSFTTTSTVIWIAMQIAEEQWGWRFRTPGEFLDRFITQAFADYGFRIHGYVILPGASVAPEKAQGDGNVAEPEKEVSEWTGGAND